MKRTARIALTILAGLLPLGVYAASLDDVTMHVMGANEQATDVTNNIEIPDQATVRDGNRNEHADDHAQDSQQEDSESGNESPGQMNQHATDAIEGTPAAEKHGGGDK